MIKRGLLINNANDQDAKFQPHPQLRVNYNGKATERHVAYACNSTDYANSHDQLGVYLQKTSHSNKVSQLNIAPITKCHRFLVTGISTRSSLGTSPAAKIRFCAGLLGFLFASWLSWSDLDGSNTIQKVFNWGLLTTGHPTYPKTMSVYVCYVFLEVFMCLN